MIKGVLAPMQGYEGAMTMFLESSDLVVLEQVSRHDHRQLQVLWRTCESLCGFDDPNSPRAIPLLRNLEEVMRPLCRPYVWTVAHKTFTEWYCECIGKSRHACMAWMMDLSASPMCPKEMECHCGGLDWSAYEVRPHEHTLTPHYPFRDNPEDDDMSPTVCRRYSCGRLQSVWAHWYANAPRGFIKCLPGRSLTSTMLEVVVDMGLSFHYIWLNHQERMLDPTILMWFSLGIAPKLHIDSGGASEFTLETTSAAFRAHRQNIVLRP
jgi:hypothetical protein